MDSRLEPAFLSFEAGAQAGHAVEKTDGISRDIPMFRFEMQMRVAYLPSSNISAAGRRPQKHRSIKSRQLLQLLFLGYVGGNGEDVEGEGGYNKPRESPIQFVQAGEDPDTKILKRRKNRSPLVALLG